MKIKSFLWASLTGLIVISVLSACQSTKSATASKMLKFNFENGKGYDYEMTMSLDQDIKEFPMKMDMTSYYSIDVTGEEGAAKILSTQFDRVRMKMNMAGLDIDVDSDKKTTDDKGPMGIMNKIFGAMTGRRFVMKVNAEGKVEEVSGLNGMAKAMADSLGLEGEDREQLVKTFDKTFNEADMKGQFERFLYIFPNKEIKVGDTWDRSTVAGGQMPGKYNSTYTVKEIEGDMVTLEEKSTITARESGEDAGMSGKVNGILVVDSRSGLVVNADQDMSMNVEKNGQKVTLNAKMKTKGKAR